MKIIKNIVLVTFVIFCFQNCKNIQEQENKNKYNLSYRVDTLKIVNKRYMHKCGIGMEWYSIIAPYPVFTSDSIPFILMEYNEKIRSEIESNAIKTIHDYYDLIGIDSDYLLRNYKVYSISDTGTVEERINKYLNTTKIDTLMFEYSYDIYVAEKYVSIGIDGYFDNGWKRLDIHPEANPCCFNMLLFENRELKAKDCFKFKDEMIDDWKKFFLEYFSPNVKRNILTHPDSVFSPVDFNQPLTDLITLYFKGKYGKALVGTWSIEELTPFFEINYLNEIKKEKK